MRFSLYDVAGGDVEGDGNDIGDVGCEVDVGVYDVADVYEVVDGDKGWVGCDIEPCMGYDAGLCAGRNTEPCEGYEAGARGIVGDRTGAPPTHFGSSSAATMGRCAPSLAPTGVLKSSCGDLLESSSLKTSSHRWRRRLRLHESQSIGHREDIRLKTAPYVEDQEQQE